MKSESLQLLNNCNLQHFSSKKITQSVSQSAKQTSLAGRLSDCLQPKSTWARIQLKSLVSMITLSSEDNTKILPQEDWISKEMHTNINTTNTNATNDETNKNLNVDLLRDLSFHYANTLFVSFDYVADKGVHK